MKRLRISRTSYSTSIRINVTARAHVTLYSIRRDHSIDTGIFQINVPEAAHRGIGVQINAWPAGNRRQLLGASITFVGGDA